MTQKSLKFCMVSTFYPPYNFGGDGMHIYRLSNELARLGHSVDVFHCEDSFLLLNKKQPTGDFPNHPLVKVHKLKSGKGWLSPLLTQQTGSPIFKPGLKKALEENGYDVIHYHNMSLIGIKALDYGTAIKLYTTHEHWLVCPMHVLWKFDREVCTEKSCTRCQIAGGRPPQLWRQTGLMDRMLKNVDCFLAPSKFTLRKHQEMGLDIPMRHMPYFLPPVAETKGARRPGTQERPFFLFVGRLEYIKGAQNLLPQFADLPEFDLVIAGDGNYREQLEKEASGRPNIKFLGRVSQEQLDDLYRTAVAVIVPSVCYETFGIIIIEAFARKTPVIVNDLGALPEVVTDSQGGVIYRNADELKKAIFSLAGDPDLRKEMGQRGFEAFQQYWTTDAHLRSYLSLVEEIAQQKSQSQAHRATSVQG